MMLMPLIKKFFGKKRLSILLCVLFMASGFLSLSLVAAEAEKPASQFPVKLPSPPEAVITEGNTPEYVVIRPNDQATFSSETAAGVAEIYVKEGSSFHAGDILLELDCRLQKAELKKALAQQSAAKMSLAAAKKLKSYGSISEMEMVKAASEEEIANAEVDKLNAIVEKCVIKAPFNGAVAELMVHAHESVKPGDPLLKIINTDNLEFEIQVPSCWLQWLHIGSEFNVHINETHTVIPAKITKINPLIESISQSVKLIGTITPNNPTLLPGMSGQAIFADHPETKCGPGKI
jgi:membrane fusion protein (multidrug efflux system)